MRNKLKKFIIFDSDALKNFHKRIFFSIIIFICFYFLAIYRIADVMIFDINDYIFFEEKNNQERGKIYDRNGYLLSANIKSYSLFARPFKILNKSKLSRDLSEIINIEEDILLTKLETNKNFIYLKRNITPKEHQKIIKLGEINIKTLLENKRIYPYINAGSHIVGYVDIDNKGQAGVEKSFDDILSKGKNIFLTIDINLQNAVRKELASSVNKFSADSGLSIIMDVKNGEILALNNYPDFDPNNIQLSNSDERLNRVLQSNYEMGSTFKPLTVAMGIDYNIINSEMFFDVSKPIKKKIHDFHPYDGSLNIKDIIVKSSNIGTAKIAKKIGKKNQIDFFKKLGFFETVKINLREAAKPLGNQNHWGELETMTIGYGHGFAVTPMHLAVAYTSILNKGKKIDPKIIFNKQNNENVKILKNSTSDYILKLLRAVVLETEYTGPRVKIEGYEIGGKTGTAELLDKKGNYIKDANRTLFLGAFPMSNPKYLVLTIINNPKKIKEENFSITGATVNAPLVKNIILKMIEVLNIPKIFDEEILNAATTLDYEIMHAFN